MKRAAVCVTPGHEPHAKKSPEEPEGNCVIVTRDAEVEIAEEMLVEEVKPEPAVDVAGRGLRDDPRGGPEPVGEDDAGDMALGWITQAGEDVPRRGDGEEDEGAECNVELAKARNCSAQASRS